MSGKDTSKEGTLFFNPEKKYVGIGLDLAKHFISVYAIDEDGDMAYEPKMPHEQLLQELANIKPTPIVMEACAGSMLLGAKLSEIGQLPHLLPGKIVSSRVQAVFPGKKNDRNDAHVMALMAQEGKFYCEIVIKTQLQRRLGSLLVARNQLVGQRTKLTNVLKGLMQEEGIRLRRQGISAREISKYQETIEKNEELKLINDLYRLQIKELTEKVDVLSERIASIVKENQIGKNLMTIPGVGSIVAAALIAIIGDAKRFNSPKRLCAYLGMVPNDFSSGGKTKMGHISKRGDRMLRKLLVQSGMSLQKITKSKSDSLKDTKLKEWVEKQRRKTSSKLKLAVACGAKLAKIALAIMQTNEPFQKSKAAVSIYA